MHTSAIASRVFYVGHSCYVCTCLSWFEQVLSEHVQWLLQDRVKVSTEKGYASTRGTRTPIGTRGTPLGPRRTPLGDVTNMCLPQVWLILFALFFMTSK